MVLWEVAGGFLAAEIDQLSYDMTLISTMDTVEGQGSAGSEYHRGHQNGNTEYTNDFLNAMISDSVRGRHNRHFF